MDKDLWHPEWLIPQWPAPIGVHAVCSTRAGGCSRTPYDALNLGDHVNDAAHDVAKNRAIFQEALGSNPIFLTQVHSTGVLHLNNHTPPGIIADASLTDQPGLACTIMVADCLPVLLTSSHGNWVAAAHAGWRGLAGHDGAGILENTYKHICALEPVHCAHIAPEIIAWLGPCVGPLAFEVGGEVRAVFLEHDPLSQSMFNQTAKDKWLVNLAGLARQRLNAMGIKQIFGNDSTAAWCTFGNPSRFFSHRRDRISGRFAVSIWRD